jgi:hypothetical protein
MRLSSTNIEPRENVEHSNQGNPMKHPPLSVKTCTRAASAIALSALAGVAHSSCGAAFCTLMTDRYAQGTGEPHVGWSADVRIEAVTQDRLRTGTKNIAASEVTSEEAIERQTKNLNVVTTLSYGIDESWSVSLRAPVVKRNHLHDLVDVETGLPSTPEQWRFTKLGDVQLVARRQFVADGGASSYALFGGVKLPTGSTKVTNADGGRAERSLQPGSGTTDALFGLAGRRAVGMADAAIWQISAALALNTNEDFKPGKRVEVSVGWSHAYSHQVGAVLQVNLRHRSRDSGAQAEPSNSGSTTLDLSPGVTLGIGQASTLYAYLQLPVYQSVNGIQLVPRSALALGWTADF